MAIRLSVKNVVLFILLLLVAAVFAISAFTKLIAITPFEWSFMDIGFSPTLAAITARVFVGLEFFIAAMLLFHLYLKPFTYKLAIASLLFFSGYLIFKLVTQGNEGDCGCFGESFYMSPLMALLKNAAMLVALFLLQRFYDYKRIYNLQPFIAATLGMASLALVFVMLPMTKKPEPIDLSPLYSNKQKQNPAVDVRDGKHIVAFMSLTCPHCRDAAKKINELYKQDKSLPFLVVLNGSDDHLAEFFSETKLSAPYTRFKGPEEFVAMAGPYVPTIYYVDRGIKMREIQYQDLNIPAIKKWLSR